MKTGKLLEKHGVKIINFLGELSVAYRAVTQGFKED
jgi:hypothetical protein